jgi:hypothetical protein
VICSALDNPSAETEKYGPLWFPGEVNHALQNES